MSIFLLNSYVYEVADTPVERIANAEDMSFNGTDQYIQAPNSSIFNLGTNYSFSFWVNNAILNTGTQIQGLITCDSSSGASGTRGWLIFQYGQELKIVAQDPSGNSLTVSNFFTTNNTWIHVGITYDGTTIKAYKDGSFFLGSTPAAGAMVLNANSQDLIIGNNAFALGRFFEGKLDEIAIFNTALSASKIQQIYDATAVVDGEVKTANLFTGGLDSSLVYWNRMGDS